MNYLIQQAVENAKQMERVHTKFRMITCLTVQEAMDFYLAFARFPNDEEIKAIRTVGIDNLIRVMRLGQGGVSVEDIKINVECIKNLQSTIADFEALSSARFRFNEALKNFIKAVFKRKKK